MGTPWWQLKLLLDFVVTGVPDCGCIESSGGEVSIVLSLQQKDGVLIVCGKDEGVHAWVTANYLFGTIKASAPPDTPTYAALDLNSSSTQIVFEPQIRNSRRGSMSTTFSWVGDVLCCTSTRI